MPHFECEYCSAFQEAPAGSAGKKAKCPRCRQTGIIQENEALVVPKKTPTRASDDIDLMPQYEERPGGPLERFVEGRLEACLGSTLARKHFGFADQLMAATILGAPKVILRTNDSGTVSQSPLLLESKFAVQTTSDITAVEVTFLLFDVWNDLELKLTHSILEDVPAASVAAGLRTWPVLRGFNVSHYLTSFTYVSSVRLAHGRVQTTDPRVVVDLLSGLELRFENRGTFKGASQPFDLW